MKLLFQLFIFFLPTQLAYHFWPDFAFVRGIRVDYLAPTIYFSELILMALFLAWFIQDRGVLLRVLSNKSYLVLALFFVVNMMVAQNPYTTFLKWIRVGEAAGVYFFVKNKREVAQLARLPFFLALLISLGLSVLQIVKAGSIGGMFYWLGERTFSANTPGIALFEVNGREYLRPYAAFAHPNVMAGFSLATLFVYWRKKDALSRLIVVVCIGITGIAFSQNALAALLLAPILYYLARRARDGYWKLLVSAAVASFFLAVLPLGGPKEIFERTELNRLAGELISVYPVFGVGLNGFILNSEWILQPVHNVFLLITAELGLLGLLGLVYFLGKNIDENNALPAIAIILTGMFDHYWVTMFPTLMLAAIIFGLSGSRRALLKSDQYD